MYDRGLSEEQRMMRQSCRDFVDEVVLPFIKQNWQREWSMVPEDRLPPSILEGAEKIGIRTLGVPEEFGGVELEKGTEVATFAMIAEEIARGDSGLADKLVQNWKVSVLLRQFAPQAFAGEMVQAAGRRAAISDGALPDRAARRLRPLAALQRAGSRDADQGGEGQRRLGDQRPQAVHLQRLRRQSSTWSTPTPIRRSACCRARRRSWCRARPRALRSRAATRRSAAAS